MVQDLQQHPNVWLMFANPAGNLQMRLLQALQASGMTPCQRIDYQQREALILTQLARSEADCAERRATVQPRQNLGVSI
jgi:hypothetical protein